jgi:ribosomal protein S21
MIEVKRKERESSAGLLRRFQKKVRQSGVLSSARKNMFYIKPKNKRQQKESALRREKLRTLRRRMLKTGELDPREKIDLSKVDLSKVEQ